MAISEKVVDVCGLPVHYWEGGAGNGRSMLLLHGGIGEAWTNWKHVMPALAEDYHVFAPDLPGFGGSAALPDLTMDALIVWLRNFLDMVDQQEVVVIGNFIGALLARMFAAAEPIYVPAVILVNGGMFPEVPPLLSRLVNVPVIGRVALGLMGLTTRSRRRIEQLVVVKEVLEDEMLRAWRDNSPGFVNILHAMLTYSYPAECIPPVPTMLLWGADDPMLTLTQAETLQSQLPGSRLEVIANCGSLPQLEAPDVFLFQVSSFLDRITRTWGPVLPGVGMLRSFD